ncbi:TPA: 4Fe-4S dicluster domain-containing protein [Clostridium perfringens]|nr:4Fe-4S dicluster domain-containing protein [Clostridium perfringens]
MEKIYPTLFKEKSECCGCSACFSICPVQAIDMIMDKNGFYYPEITKEQCIKCYKCLKVCDFKDNINY